MYPSQETRPPHMAGDRASEHPCLSEARIPSLWHNFKVSGCTYGFTFPSISVSTWDPSSSERHQTVITSNARCVKMTSFSDTQTFFFKKKLQKKTSRNASVEDDTKRVQSALCTRMRIVFYAIRLGPKTSVCREVSHCHVCCHRL